MPEVLILNTDDCCYGVLRVARATPPPATSAAGASTIWAVIAAGIHLFPFRTEKLSPPAPMVLGAQAPGRVGRRPVFPQDQDPPSGDPDRATVEDARFAGSFASQSVRQLRRRAAPRLLAMELRDGDLVLATVDGGRRRRDGRRLQRPRGRAVDPDDSLIRTRRRTRSRSSAARFAPRPPPGDRRSTGASWAESGWASTRTTIAATIGLLGRAQPTAGRDLLSCAATSLPACARRARAPTGRSDHRSGQRRVATCRREGRVPARGRPSRAPPPSRTDAFATR